MARDSQREKLYRAERRAYPASAWQPWFEFKTFEGSRRFADSVVNSPVFTEFMNMLPWYRDMAPMEVSYETEVSRGTVTYHGLPRFKMPPVTIVENNSSAVNPPALARTHVRSGQATILLPPRAWAHSMPTILHELSHVALDASVAHLPFCRFRHAPYEGLVQDEVAPHGKEFAAILLGLVARFMGVNYAQTLKSEMVTNKVKFVDLSDNWL